MIPNYRMQASMNDFKQISTDAFRKYTPWRGEGMVCSCNNLGLDRVRDICRVVRVRMDEPAVVFGD